jgi:GTPase
LYEDGRCRQRRSLLEKEVPTHRKSVAPASAANRQKNPLIAIVGRPNVGKSTLFNRLVGKRRSIVGDEPGITRDRIYGQYEWAGRHFRLVDTGGMVPGDAEPILKDIFDQASVALTDADAIVFVVDARTELSRPDYDLAQLLLRGGKPLFLAVNKAEYEAIEQSAEEFHRLGIHDLFPISAEHGRGIGELLDAISAAVPARDEAAAAEDAEPAPAEKQAEKNPSHGEFEPQEISIAIIGRPNVGKSTLLNALTGTSRAIVSPVAGTTRDAVDEVVEFGGHRMRFVDTAGIRRKGKTKLMAEKLSVVMARRHLEAADVALLMIDASEGVTGSDATIGGYAHESGRSVIVVVNKWDAVTTNRTDGKPPADPGIFEEQLRRALKYLDYAPVLFVSALEGTGPGHKGMQRILREAVAVAAARRKRVTTGQMNRFLETLDFQRAPVPMSKRIRIFYMTQAAVAPPRFVLFTDRGVKLHFSFERFLENRIREAFEFKGTPIWFKVRPRRSAAK